MNAAEALVLVACPTYAGKEYALDSWWECVQAQTYQPRTAFCVDNTMVGTMYLKTLHDKGIPAIHLQPWTDAPMEKTFKRCWELILEEAKRQDAFWVFSLEADNIVPPDALEKMVKLATYANCHMVTHDYPMHAEAAAASGMKMTDFYYTEFGVLLMTRQLLERAFDFFDDAKKLWVALCRANEAYRGGHIRLTRLFDAQHLDGWAQEFPQFQDPAEDEPSICPTPEFPDYIGTELPPTLARYVQAKETTSGTR